NWSSFFFAAPESSASPAFWAPSFGVLTTPAATRATAALRTTMSRFGPFFPARISRAMAALAVASPPARSAAAAGGTPIVAGPIVTSVNAAPVISMARLSPGVEHLGHGADEAGREDPDHLGVRSRGIAQRPEEVEDGPEPKLLADGAGVL